MQTAPVKKDLVSPEFAATVFFGIFAVLFLIFTKYSLLPLGLSANIPVVSSFIVALFTAIFLSRIFAKSLSGQYHWIRIFLTGVFMAMLAIVISSLVFFIRAWFYDAALFQLAHHWQDYFILFGLRVAMTASIIGVWLGLLTGIAALYFNKHFYPRLKAFENTHPQSNHTPDE